MKDYNFTQPFAIRCDAKQFESVKNELEKMGYSDNGKSDGCIYFTNNVNNTMGDAGLILPKRQYYYHRLIIETFNRPLLLALAAMTDKPDGIVGEWWMCNIGDNIHFIKDKLYQQNGMIGNFPQFVSEKDEVIACDVTEWFRKATADELIKHFTENVATVFGSVSKSNPAQTETERLQKQISELTERNTENERQIEILWKCVKAHVKQLRELEERQLEPKQELQDKQEVWAWDNNDTAIRHASFYDAKNKCVFSYDGYRDYHQFDNYEPILTDQIPQWMKEAKLKLED